jgi:hypothetical protein
MRNGSLSSSVSFEGVEKEKQKEKEREQDTNKMGGIKQSLIFNYLCLVCTTNFGVCMRFWGISSFG